MTNKKIEIITWLAQSIENNRDFEFYTNSNNIDIEISKKINLIKKILEKDLEVWIVATKQLIQNKKTIEFDTISWDILQIIIDLDIDTRIKNVINSGTINF